MDNNDADSIGSIKDATGQQLHVVRIYPLDGKPVAESQFWISVVQLNNEIAKRLFLRDGQQHRSISVESALQLLSSEDKKDLSAILKIVLKKGGAASYIPFNAITPITNENMRTLDGSADCDKQHTGFGNIQFDSRRANNQALIKVSSDSQIAVANAVAAAQLKGWGSIRVTGSEYFRRQLWLEAASRGMYVEGYMHTEDDRKALFMRTQESSRAYIRPEYRPANLQNRSGVQGNRINQKDLNVGNKKTIEIEDLSDQELTDLLMRVHQMELTKLNVREAFDTMTQVDLIVAESGEIQSSL